MHATMMCVTSAPRWMRLWGHWQCDDVYMYMCVYMCISKYVYFSIYKHIYVWCTWKYVYLNICKHIYVYICKCMYMYMYMHIYLCIYAYIYMYIYMYIYSAEQGAGTRAIANHIRTCTWRHIFIYMFANHIRTCTCMYIFIYMFANHIRTVHVCTYLYICIYIHIISIYLYICIFPWSTHTVSRLEKWSGLFFFLEKSPAHRMHLLLQCVFWRWFRRRMDFGFFKDSLAQEPYLLRALLMEYRSVFLECRAVLASIS